MKKAILNLGFLSIMMMFMTSFSTDHVTVDLLSYTSASASRGAGQYIPPGDKPKLDFTMHRGEGENSTNQIIPYEKVML